MIDLLKSIQSGEISESPFGINRSKLISIYGETKDVVYASKKEKIPSIYKFGKVEFYFEPNQESKLHGIMIQLVTQSSEEGILSFNYSYLSSDLCLSKAKTLLIESGIKFTQSQSQSGEPTLETENGFVFYFFEDLNICKVGKFL